VSVPALTVVLITRDRAPILERSLAMLAAQNTPLPFEIIVSDDGSTDATPAVVAGIAAEHPGVVRHLPHSPVGVAAGRNLAIAEARAPAVLVTNDDDLPGAGLLARHIDFHREFPEREAAMVGRVAPHPEELVSAFMRWLESSGIRWGVQPGADGLVPAHNFHGANTSVKTELLRAVGGFDPAFALGCDDCEVGVRLEGLGMRLSYDEAAVTYHLHPAGLEATLARLRAYGSNCRRFADIHDRIQGPRPPGPRHRAHAAGLWAATRAGIRNIALRERCWRFLCHQAHREGFWGAPKPASGSVAIGNRLERLAVRDPDAIWPA
jgi:GT2 family glycosyltransferase